MERLENVDMGQYTSFRTGGRAREMVVCETAEELLGLMRSIHESGSRSIVLGNGSNTLICDAGFDGIVVRLGEAFTEICREGDRLLCGSGALLSAVARKALAEGLSGFESPVWGGAVSLLHDADTNRTTTSRIGISLFNIFISQLLNFFHQVNFKPESDDTCIICIKRSELAVHNIDLYYFEHLT